MNKIIMAHSKICKCSRKTHAAKSIVITGGPGAGKSAVLEIARQAFCQHVIILPEAAGIIFGGGFLRENTISARKGAQRAIYFVQREQERIFEWEKSAGVVLCDRGTLDCLAYWPGSNKQFFSDIGSSHEKELQKYWAVIHLRTPSLKFGYNNDNPLRIERAKEAAEIDKKTARVWNGHPRRIFIDASQNFLEKAKKAIALIMAEVPECCRSTLVI